MTSSTTLLIWNEQLGELPIITFDYEVELVDITVTTTHEVYVLVRRSLDQVHVLFNLEDAFMEPHILLGTMQALLIGNSLLLVDQGALWECELGTKNWGFVRKQREGDILANGVNRGPWGVMEDFRYAIINQNSVILESGEQFTYESVVRGVAVLPGGIFVLAGNSIFVGSKKLCDAPAKTKTLYVRGKNVYVMTEDQTLIFSQDAVSHYRSPRIDFCL